MAVDPASPVPLHEQIRRALAAEIAAATWPPGAALPSEATLARRFGVSRMTVRQALGALAQRGLLERRRGRATRVAAPVEQSLGRFYAFAHEMDRLGRAHLSRVLAVGLAPAPAAARAALGLGAREPAARIALVRLLGDEPLLLETAYVRAPLLPVLASPAVAHTSLYDLLAAEAGLAVTRATERIRPIVLGAGRARLLGVRPRQSAFLVERTSYAGEAAVEWRESVARGDRYRLVAELRRDELALVPGAAEG